MNFLSPFQFMFTCSYITLFSFSLNVNFKVGNHVVKAMNLSQQEAIVLVFYRSRRKQN